MGNAVGQVANCVLKPRREHEWNTPRRADVLTQRAIAWLAVRGGVGCGCILLEYAALKYLPLKVNAMIVYSSPAFAVLWAACLLQQPVHASVVALIALSFGGLLIEVHPWAISETVGAPLWSYLAAVMSAALAGLVYVALRVLATTNFMTVLSSFLWMCLTLSVVFGWLLGELHFPRAEPRLWAHLVGMGFFAYMAEVFITCGYQRAADGVGQVSVLKYLSPVSSMLLGCLLLGEQITWMDLAGAVLILGSSGAIVFVQAKGSAPDRDEDVENEPIKEVYGRPYPYAIPAAEEKV